MERGNRDNDVRACLAKCLSGERHRFADQF